MRKKEISRCSFNLSHYESILKTALENDYQFVFFKDKGKGHTKRDNQRVCYLRHDIDYMPKWSKEMALIESQLSVYSTYFFQLNSPIYNVRDKQVYQVIQYIKSLGHRIGLHFDPAWYDNLALAKYWRKCNLEKEILRRLLDLEICEAVSFHCPSKCILGSKVKKVISTYEPKYFTEIKYVSDSQGWSEGCACNIFKEKKYKKMQLLIHPYLWPKVGGYNFSKDMANIISLMGKDVLRYMVNFHPVCARNKSRLIKYYNSLKWRA